jgi:iron-sulfur cluster insertion protein
MVGFCPYKAYNNIMTINVDASAVKRIEDLRKSRATNTLMLRVTVNGGGCSGFQYKIELTDKSEGGDETFAGVFVTDEISLPFLDGATVRYAEGLIGSEFVIDNPNAASGCGCGASFSV